MIKKVKNIVLWTYVITDLSGKEIVEAFYEKQLQKSNQEELKVEKVISSKGDILNVKYTIC